MATMMDPDCRAGKHDNCSGEGWDEETDAPGPCPCACHEPQPEDCTDAPECPAEWHHHDCAEDNGACDAPHLHVIAAS